MFLPDCSFTVSGRTSLRVLFDVVFEGFKDGDSQDSRVTILYCVANKITQYSVKSLAFT